MLYLMRINPLPKLAVVSRTLHFKFSWYFINDESREDDCKEQEGLITEFQNMAKG